MGLKDEYRLLVLRQYPEVFTEYSGSGTTANKPPIFGGCTNRGPGPDKVPKYNCPAPRPTHPRLRIDLAEC